MALKKKLDKTAYDALPEHFKSEYIADGEGGFKLDVEGDEDAGALKRALLREKENAATSKTRLAEVEAQLEEMTAGDARKNKDIATLEKGWQKKADESKAAYEERINKLTSHATKNLVDNVALSMATKLSPKNTALLLPHIKARLIADFEGDEPATKILRADGKPSDLTIEQLHAEFVANKDFSSIIIGSQASGGAGQQSRFQNGGAGNNDQQQTADYSKMSVKDLAARITERKAQQQEAQ